MTSSARVHDRQPPTATFDPPSRTDISARVSLPSSPLTGSNHAVPAVVSGHEIPHPQVPGPCAGGGAAPGDGYRFDENLWRELIAVWFPEVVDPTARAVTWPAIAAHHTWIEGQLDESVTVATIAQRPRCPGIGINCASLYFGAIRRSGRGVESHDAPRSGPAGRRRSGRVFGDQAVAAAMIDRIVHHADVLTLEGAGYRL